MLRGLFWWRFMRKSCGKVPIQFWFLSSPIPILPNQQFYVANRYIHVTEEGEEESLFVLADDVFPDDRAGGIGPLAVGGKIVLMVKNQTMPQFYYWAVR